jgi:hypothetical protein
MTTSARVTGPFEESKMQDRITIKGRDGAFGAYNRTGQGLAGSIASSQESTMEAR